VPTMAIFISKVRQRSHAPARPTPVAASSSGRNPS
jgi:hypothetical protein